MVAHPDHNEQKLLQHWAPDAHAMEGAEGSDATHSVTANVLGKPRAFGDAKAEPLVALCEKYGVDVAFAGHIHGYERTRPILEMQVNLGRGVTYIVSGGGGGGLENAAPNRTWFQKHVHSAHHYCFATVHGDLIEFSA